MKPIFKNQTSFDSLEIDSDNDKLTYLAGKKAQQILDQAEPIQLSQVQSEGHELSPLLSLMIGLFISLVKGSSKDEIGDKIGSSLFSDILSTHIKVPLLRLIAGIIQKKLYKRDGNYEQISYSIIFKNCLISFFLSIVSENSSLIGMERLVNLHRNLMADNYILYVPIYLYFMYGGSLFTIERKSFKNQFNKLIANLSYVLAREETIMTRNFQEIKTNKSQSDVVNQSLNIVCCSTNKQYMEEISQRLCQLIFGQKDYIKKEQFCEAVSKIPQNDKTREFIFFYINLIRLELQISEARRQSPNIQQQQKGKNSFYTTQMQKILKKCPYNGDNKCDCKKCQCVRRNRQSAKLSQQKKRNAVEQLEPMKQKIISLEIRNCQLQEENMILKGLLNSFKNNPQFKSLLMNTIEPVSKILRDN